MKVSAKRMVAIIVACLELQDPSTAGGPSEAPWEISTLRLVSGSCTTRLKNEMKL
jgi:hypothetical protein